MSKPTVNLKNLVFPDKRVEISYRDMEKFFGVEAPLRVTEITFNHEKSEIDVAISLEPGAVFRCECGAEDHKIHLGRERSWRHVNVGNYLCFFRMSVPSLVCPIFKTKAVPLSFAGKNSRLTKAMEESVLKCLRHLSSAMTARILNLKEGTVRGVAGRAVLHVHKKTPLTAPAALAPGDDDAPDNPDIPNIPNRPDGSAGSAGETSPGAPRAAE
ncbi:MAG: hypothetical protein LBF41_02435 [Deltaproteobacteria bacterium]|jgi:hypothetical protein|nr:hypothetical protein [Deltaproteobacteria bacterium]